MPDINMMGGMPKPDNHEAAMARADLYKLANYSFKLFKMVKDGDELEGWVQAKITKAADYIASVYHFMEYEMKFSEYGEKLETSDVYSESVKREYMRKLTEARVKLDKLRKKNTKDIGEGWEDLEKARKEREDSKGTGKFDSKKTEKGTKYTRKTDTFSDEREGTPAKQSKAAKSAAEKKADKARDIKLPPWKGNVTKHSSNKGAEKDDGTGDIKEERTEVKDKSGKVVSWKDETDWKKAGNKNPRGKVTNLSDKARRETEKNVKESGIFRAGMPVPQDPDGGSVTDPKTGKPLVPPGKVGAPGTAAAMAAQARKPKVSWDPAKRGVSPGSSKRTAGADTMEALKGGQKKLDTDKDGKLEKSDFAKLRASKSVKEAEEKCNHTAKGKKCPLHGLKECGPMEGLGRKSDKKVKESWIENDWNIEGLTSRAQGLIADGKSPQWIIQQYTKEGVVPAMAQKAVNDAVALSKTQPAMPMKESVDLKRIRETMKRLNG